MQTIRPTYLTLSKFFAEIPLSPSLPDSNMKSSTSVAIGLLLCAMMFTSQGKIGNAVVSSSATAVTGAVVLTEWFLLL